jgi:two-component system, OmpR family, alkaline phosphatase synthesis response regulator PhoP
MSIKRILLVDDDDLVRTSTQVCLEVTGEWEVITASSGIEGLSKAEVEQPDVILLDVMMPDMDGLATFQQLQTNPKTQEIPVFLLTAKAQAVEKRQYTELGVVGVIVKPFDPLTLTDQIEEGLMNQNSP